MIFNYNIPSKLILLSYEKEKENLLGNKFNTLTKSNNVGITFFFATWVFQIWTLKLEFITICLQCFMACLILNKFCIWRYVIQLFCLISIRHDSDFNCFGLNILVVILDWTKKKYFSYFLQFTNTFDCIHLLQRKQYCSNIQWPPFFCPSWSVSSILFQRVMIVSKPPWQFMWQQFLRLAQHKRGSFILSSTSMACRFGL